MAVNREYKATLFSELFSEPDRLRELYNALADTDYGKDTPVEINTLESAFFNDLRNDVSFTIDNKYVVLLEHQSTINANMPLRFLQYITRVYEKITDDRAIYNEKQIEIPTPEFIVLYNGTKPFPAEKMLRLSDAYKGADKNDKRSGSLELTVRILNINPGFNDELLQKSKTLNGYTSFIERVRNSQISGNNLQGAIKEAIARGISQNILRKFLTEHGTEVSGMLFGTTFDIDIAKEVWQEEAREDLLDVIADKDAEIAENKAEIADKDAEIARLTVLVEKLQSEG